MKISRILGFNLDPDKDSAHEVHLDTIAYDENGHAQHVVFKKNKYPGAFGQETSKLEASFTSIANAFCAPHRALRQDIVTDSNDEIVGMCTEHTAHALIRMNQKNKNIVFLQAGKNSLPSGLASREEFENWLNGHTPTHKNKWGKIHHSDEYETLYQKRWEQYWVERKMEDRGLKSLAQVDFDNAVMYCKEQLEEGLTEFDLNKIPQEMAFKSDLLEAIFEGEKLKLKCESAEIRAANIQQEIDVTAFGVGKAVNFLDKLPQNFFARLLEQKQLGNVDIDMDSLADVFTTAYALEEDDLHKGNISYYVTQENGRPCFHFFKIDHDLLFSDKIMASRTSRFANIHYSSDKFRITAQDLIGFPDLQDSGNHYWPTKKALFVKGMKAYQSEEDRSAYKSLKDDPDFQKAKWSRFLKQTVIPQSFLSKCLHQPLAEKNDDPEIASTMAMVLRATSSRISELRITLMEIPEFRKYVRENFNEALILVSDEISQHCSAIGCTPQEIEQYQFEVQKTLTSIKNVSEKNAAEKTLHAAIETQSYRCYETAKYFKKILNNKDETGKTGLDFAINKYNECEQILQNSEVLQSPEGIYYKELQVYYADVIGDLHANNAQHSLDTGAYQAIVARAEKNNSLSLIPTVTSLDEYKEFLTMMRTQPLRTLKQDKVCALKALEKAQLSEEDLLQLKKELKQHEPPGPLKFIKELRSELWIIKKIRGVYGETTTSRDMMNCINSKLDQLNNVAQEERNFSAQ